MSANRRTAANWRSRTATGRARHVCVIAAFALLSALGCRADRPGPFIFIHGLQGRDAAQIAPALGCNTIYFDLPIDAPLNIASVRAFIAEAHEADLSVIIGLRTSMQGQYPVTPTDAEYLAAMREWVGGVVGGLRDELGIVGWATDHDLERDIAFSDADFRRHLLTTHGSLDGLNLAWGTRFLTMAQVGRSAVAELDADQPFGVGRASIDLAEYRRGVFRELMQIWADEVRRHDSGHLLFTGRISRYRGLTAVPDAFDVVLPCARPDVLERDLLTHNVQAVQIARRGGKFEVIPWLRVPLPLSQAATSRALSAWIAEAGMRGAIGVCLEDWSRINASDRSINDVAEQVPGALAMQPFTQEPPAPVAAVIYSPYAGGPGKLGTPYGYLPEFEDSDLAALAYGYRGGTIFGGLDYLCPEDLPEVDLSRYSVLLAPMCLSLPADAVETLSSYLRAGGALLADIGLGMYQAGSWAPSATALAPQLGVAGNMAIAARFGDFRVGQPHPQLPSVTKGLQATGIFVPGKPVDVGGGSSRGGSFTGAATQFQGHPFQGPSCFVALRDGAIPLATMSVRYDDASIPHFLGLVANGLGDGLAVFGALPLWTYWPAEDTLHGALHLDLIRRRATWRLLKPGLLTEGVQISSSQDMAHLLNRGAATQAQVLCATADHRAFLGAITVFSASETDATGRRTGRVRLNIDLPAGALTHVEATAVQLRPAQGECCVRMSCYGPGLIAMHVGGQGAVWRSRREQAPTFHDGQSSTIRFGVEDGTYPVSPGSTHQVTWQEVRQQPRSATVTADHRGRLDFSLVIAGAQVWVRPVNTPGAGAGQ